MSGISIRKKIVFGLLMLVAGSALGQDSVVDNVSIQSKIFNSERRIKVSLPSGYGSYPDQRYIVAYLFDAQSESFFNFFRETINYLTGDGYMNRVILVGIASGNRQFEFTPKPETAQGVKYFMKSGGADSLAIHLRDEVMPAINKKYRCLNYNIGIGHSLGATFLTYCLLSYPALFNAYIAISPNYVFDQEQLIHKFDSARNHQIFDHKYLYLAHGSGDDMEDKFKAPTEKVGNMLKTRNITGLRWQFKDMDNNNHGLTAMEGVFKGLVALFSQFTLAEKINLADSFYKDKRKPFMEHVKNYYQSASNWAGITLPLIDDVNGFGYNCFYLGKKKEALEVFAWALTLFPDNINLYDSMGELQQASGNRKEALDYYNRGMQTVNKLKPKLDATTYNNMLTGFENRIKSLNNP